MKPAPRILLAVLLLTLLPLQAQVPGRGGWRLPGRERSEARPLEWGPRAAAHLMRRAGFSASPRELDRIVAQGLDATLSELLDPSSVDDSAAEAALLARNYRLAAFDPDNQLYYGDPINLQRAWMFRMIHSRRQLLPPDVGGWPADARWINTGTMLGRFNFMAILSSKRPDLNFGLPGDDVIPIERIAAENELLLAAEFVNHFVRAMLQDDLSMDARYALEEYMNAGDRLHPGPFDANNPALVDKKVRGLIQLVSTVPVYQLN